MTNEQRNIQLVQRHFEAFGRGDIQAALDAFAEDVDFQSPVTRNAPPEITWASPRCNKQEVAAFFKELSDNMQVESMQVLGFITEGGRVVVEGRNRGTVKSTGGQYEHDWVMVFTIRDGKIVRSRHYYDTADIVAAFRSK